MNARFLISGLVLAVGAAVRADIPQPDAIVYGTLHVGGTQVNAGEDYTILARAAGFEDPVAVYRMGDNPTAADHYVLHIPQAVEAAGMTASAKTPAAGVTARIFVTYAGGEPIDAGTVEIPVSGKVRRLDVSLSSEDVAASRAVTDTGGCGSGGGTCGAVGVISPILMMCGLIQMRTRRRP
ncbi:MAG: hypothetical protein PVI86_06575 [Phycisphaerae bacterium]|jgi:hypothetical protein